MFEIFRNLVISLTDFVYYQIKTLCQVPHQKTGGGLALLAILHQLGIAKPFMETLFTGLVAMLVISLGIAFGLGGKEVAAEILQDVKRKLKD